MTFSEEQMEYLETRSAIHDVIEATLRELWDGREDVIIMADEAADKILEITKVPNPFNQQ